MAVSRDEVRRAAALARLDLEGSELESMTRELNTILEHVDALQELDSPEALGTPVGPSEAGPGEPRRLRPDEPGADPMARDPAHQAPGWTDGFFTVPRLAALDARRPPGPGGEAAGDEVDGDGGDGEAGAGGRGRADDGRPAPAP